jgi:hypothetical protein
MHFFSKGVGQTGDLSTNRNSTLKTLPPVTHTATGDTPPAGMAALPRSVRPASAAEGRETAPLKPVAAPPVFSAVPDIPTIPLIAPAQVAPEAVVHTAPLQPRPGSGLQHAARLTDGAREMAQQGVNAVFRALAWATEPHVMSQMERRDRVVFLLLDGRRSISDIAHLIHRNELDIARTIVRLLKSGHITPVEPAE